MMRFGSQVKVVFRTGKARVRKLKLQGQQQQQRMKGVVL